MRAKRILAGIWAVLMLLSGLGMFGIMSIPVAAQPQVHFFSGSITYNGLDAPSGTYVYAEIDGTLYGQDSDQVGGGYQGGVYSMTVSGEDSANITAKEGGLDGEKVIFWIQVPGQPQPYIANQAPDFIAGGIDNSFNLVVDSTGGVQPPRVMLNQISPWNMTGPDDWVDLYNPSATTSVDLTQGWSLEDNYGGTGAFIAGDTVPPLDVSAGMHQITLNDVDGNAKLIWQDGSNMIAQGNPVVMDKAEWGPHIGDDELFGGDTIGLDKGPGPAWDPNLPNSPTDWCFRRLLPRQDRDIRDDWEVGPCTKRGIPELWPLGTVGYESDYLDPEIGDAATIFDFVVWYADKDNDRPQVGPDLHIYDQATGTPIVGSPFPMNPDVWVGATDDYVHPGGGRHFVYSRTFATPGTYCYNISVTDIMNSSNMTADFCFTVGADGTPPEILNVWLDGSPTRLVTPGTMVLLTSDIDDSSTGGSNIAGAEWSIDCTAPWTGMTATDGGFDEVAENARATIDTTTMLGIYLIYVRAWDSMMNANNSCTLFGELTVNVTDTVAPIAYMPLLNGLNPLRTTPGTLVEFTVMVDDSATGNSIIGGANWSLNLVDQGQMNPRDGALDSDVENMSASIDTSTFTTNSYMICVEEVWDVIPNYRPPSMVCADLLIDGTPPLVDNARLDGSPTPITVTDGDLVVLTADVDDTGALVASNIANAWYTINAGPNQPMTASIPPFDSTFEEVRDTIDTTGWGSAPPGTTYNLCVFGDDILGNAYTATNGNCIDLTVQTAVPDTTAPVISNLALTPSQIALDGSFTIDANVDDSGTSPYNDIQNATYDVRDSGGASVGSGTMNAVDGAYDSATEDVRATGVDATGWPEGTYTVYVHACDIVPNCDYETTTLTIIAADDLPPEVTNVVADPDEFDEGNVTTIMLNATIDDANTYGSDIQNASYVVRDSSGAVVSSGAMNAVDGAFDSPVEDVTRTINVGSWADGTYTCYVYGSDTAGNDNLTGDSTTVTVNYVGVGFPPEIGTPSHTPAAPEEGDEVTISVTVTDVEDTASELTVTITIVGPGATPIATDQVMTPTGDVFSYTTTSLSAAGGYGYVITAVDTDDNDDFATGSFTVTEKPGDGKEGIDWWIWVLLLIIIIVIVILIIWAATRRKPEEEIPPEMPPEEEIPLEEELPPEEEAFVEEEPMEEAPREEVVEEAPAEEFVEEPAPMEEEAPMEEAAPAGPMTCPNCGTVNPEGISVCTSCGSPL